MAQTFIRGTQIRDLTIGVGKLDETIIGVDGKLVASLLPAAIAGAMVYQGTFDASVDAAPEAAAAENTGHYYIISGAGNDFEVGDWIVSNGVSWDHIDNTEVTETAATTAYDNTESGLAATTVQVAIDEIDTRLKTVETRVPSACFVNELLTFTGAPDSFFPTQLDAEGANNEVIVATLMVYLNGVLQENGEDYGVSAGGQIGFVVAPQAEDRVRVTYFKR